MFFSISKFVESVHKVERKNTTAKYTQTIIIHARTHIQHQPKKMSSRPTPEVQQIDLTKLNLQQLQQLKIEFESVQYNINHY